MNTDVQVIVVGGSQADLDMATAAVHDYEARWSRFLPDSELSRLNRAEGRPVAVSPDTFRLISDAIDAYELTDGAFDPTVLAALQRAGYDRSFERVESAGELDPVAAPGPGGIELDEVPMAVRLPADLGLDLGGLGKGATADAVSELLMAAGVAGCCVNIGGDLRARGASPDPGGWVVDLACPGSSEQRRIALSDGAVCTSTTLKRRWGRGATRQHHLRDPATGRSLETGLLTVSVIGARALQADVLTKVAFAAGVASAPARLAVHHVTGLLVTDEGRIVELAGLDDFLMPGVVGP